jgi:acyl-CoA dehydrogenase
VAEPRDRSTLVAIAKDVATNVARPAAGDVDRHARFPKEAFDALRKERLLSCMVPVDLGGDGARIGDVAAVCTALGQGCASTGMIFAMHQIQVACVVRHGKTPRFVEYMRELARSQRLVASATTEEGIGGDVRQSSCAVNRSGDRFELEKRAPVISYGDDADDILVTARRAPDAASSDQVIVLTRKTGIAGAAERSGEVTLEKTHTWDTLGMRGTASLGYHLRATGPVDDILPQPYADISAETMLPFAHILWTSMWLGLATDAVNQARAYIRAEARKKPGQTPPGAFRLAELVADLHRMRGAVLDATRDYEERMNDRDALSGPSFAIRMNNLKVSATRDLVSIVSQALSIVGIAGYKSDSKWTLGRHLRDAHGAPLMVANDRILGHNAALLLVAKDD